MSRETFPKEIRPLIAKAKKMGWALENTRNCHYKLAKEGHQSIIISGSASDHRALANIKATMRREGIV